MTPTEVVTATVSLLTALALIIREVDARRRAKTEEERLSVQASTGVFTPIIESYENRLHQMEGRESEREAAHRAESQYMQAQINELRASLETERKAHAETRAARHDLSAEIRRLKIVIEELTERLASLEEKTPPAPEETGEQPY